VAAVLLVVAVYLFYQQRQASTQIDDLSNRVRQARVRLANANNNSNVDEVKAQQTALSDTLAALKPQPFDGANVMLDLWSWSQQHRTAISISELAQSAQTLGEQPYEVTTITLALTGDLSDLAAFLTTVNAASYHPVITKAKASFSQETNQWVLNTEILLYKDVNEASLETAESTQAQG